jgi:transposase-like protein
MEKTLSELIELVKHLPQKAIAEAIKDVTELKEKYEEEEKRNRPPCPHCKSANVVRNGHKHRKQAYLCRDCNKSFVQTTGTVMFNSHSGESVWHQVIIDTVAGVSLEKTSKNLALNIETVFNMRHKILCCLEQEEKRNSVTLSGGCEADETYVLESLKGQKLPPDYYRKPRKHGAVAQKCGISDEYICICTAVERQGKGIARSVNRATPQKTDVECVFGNRVNEDTLLLCDGAKSYQVLEETKKCSVVSKKSKAVGFYNINTVNNFHSFIKQRNRNAHGFATKYLNRYNSLFSRIYRQSKFVVEEIYKMLSDMDKRYNSIASSQSKNLLTI